MSTTPDADARVPRKSGPRGKWLSDQEIRDSGRCGNGSAVSFCGKPSEPGAPFGECHEHAEQFRETVRRVEQHERLNESAGRLERGYRAVGHEHRENGPGGRNVVEQRARDAQARAVAPRRRGRSR